jgi:hypothetical protein
MVEDNDFPLQFVHETLCRKSNEKYPTDQATLTRGTVVKSETSFFLS